MFEIVNVLVIYTLLSSKVKSDIVSIYTSLETSSTRDRWNQRNIFYGCYDTSYTEIK